MFKPILALGIFWLGLNLVWAQDMPPLPSMPGESAAPADNSTAAPLPALPGQAASPSTENAAPLPALPGQAAAPSADNTNAAPLPALPNQEGGTSATLPSLPGDQSAAPAENSTAAPLPALPGQAAAPTAENTNAAPLPALPGQATAPSADNANAAPLPALPNQGGGTSTTLPALPSTGGTSTESNNAATMPALPTLGGASSENANAGALPVLPGKGGASAQVNPTPAPTGENAATSEAASSTTEEGASPAKQTTGKKWHPPVPQANVIFGGWVLPKGGNEGSRIAWTSQEILNTFEFRGYKLIKEEGRYEGQKGRQWRQFSFRIPKTKTILQVYVRQDGKRVWMRVGPPEPPAGQSMAFVKKLKAEDLKALALLRKQFKKRLRPHRIVALWDAPYHFQKETADE